MTGADLIIIGGPAHGSGGRGHLPTPHSAQGHGLEHGRRLACGPAGRGARGCAKCGVHDLLSRV